jgi:hypothetical protein
MSGADHFTKRSIGEELLQFKAEPSLTKDDYDKNLL